MKRALSRKRLWESLPRSVRAALGRAIGALPPAMLLGARFRASHRFAREAEWWSIEQSRDYQLRRLREICTLAYEKTSFYRRQFDTVGLNPRDLATPEDIAALPTIDKTTLNENINAMCAVSPESPGVDYVSTGGTSGVPLRFYIGADRSAIEYGYLVACWQRAGYALGLRMAVFRGRAVAENSSGLRHEYDPLLRYHYYGNFHMTDDNMRRYLDHVRGIGPCFLHAYPSSADALARFIGRTGITPPENVRGIIAESEIVYPEQRTVIEEAFGTRLFSCYGHTEKLVLTAECEHSSDDHVWPTYGYFELLDEDGSPVTTPGQRGEIVGTGFINTVVPFIRYRTGDWATYVGDSCQACRRGHTIVRDIRGHRTQEVLIAEDGREISWTALNLHDDTFERVRQFQFRQDSPGRAVLRIVPAEGFGQDDRRRIHDSLDQKLDGSIDMKFEIVDEIPVSNVGKAIYVDQRIPR